MPKCNICQITTPDGVPRCGWCTEIFTNGRLPAEVLARTEIRKEDYARCDKAVTYKLTNSIGPVSSLVRMDLMNGLKALFSRAKSSHTAFTSWSLGWSISRYRVYKFKQRRLLNTLDGLDFLPELEAGACTALTLGWIATHRANPWAPAQSRIMSICGREHFFDHNTTAGDYNRVAGNRERVNAALPSDVADRHSVETNLTTFGTILPWIARRPGYYLLTMEITNNPTGHICAIFADAARMVFFDSNFGEFEVRTSNRGAFFLLLREQYQSYKNKNGRSMRLQFNNGWLFSVAHLTPPPLAVPPVAPIVARL